MGTPVARHKTAMKRMRMSRPMERALADRVVRDGDAIFDYGCGHGVDVQLLKAAGYAATGWDPHFAPDEPHRPADVVQLGYVLNVIENRQERQDALRRAFALAQRALVVAVRVDRTVLAGDEFEDGTLTKHGGFQKFFTQLELREYVESVLGVKPEVADIGVAYVFKDEAARQAYLARRIISRPSSISFDLVDLFAKDPVATGFVEECRRRGRLLKLKDVPGAEGLLERFGEEDRIRRIAVRLLDADALAAAREERRGALMTFLATTRIRGMEYPSLSNLPDEIQSDVRRLWGAYDKAKRSAEEFLFLLGKPGTVDMAARASSVGKLLPEDLYVHRSAVVELPFLLQLMVEMGALVVGSQDAQLIKLSRHGRTMSFLWYPGFDEDPHPALATSMRVVFQRADYQVRNYQGSTNPPILHRKETFVGEGYALRAKFAKLTEQEERAGVLTGPPGFQNEWAAHLASAGYRLQGHRLVRATTT